MDNEQVRGLLADLAKDDPRPRLAGVLEIRAANYLREHGARLLADSDELAKLRAEIAGACEWTFDAHSEAWDSACGEKWQFTHDGPAENNVRFCHGCGKHAMLRLPVGEGQ